MKKNTIFSSIFLLASIFISSCETNSNNSSSLSSSTSSTSSLISSSYSTIQQMPLFPDELEEIPTSYYQEAINQGELHDFYYDTYESFTYENKDHKLRKHAIIYLPFNYSESNKYDILYLMHGGWSNENSSLGTPNRPSYFKNVIDNAIENNIIKPLIIVCPTYNNTSEQDSSNFSLALQLTRNYHNELINDLIPAVEYNFSTYSENTTKNALINSRNHRMFAGFSMGSVTTWRTFEYALDYFKYFVPMSCGTSLDEENIWEAAKNRNQNDYFIMMMVGTSDFSYNYDTSRAQRMRESAYFTEQTKDNPGNFIFRTKQGYSHNGRAADEYTFNALSYIFGNS